MGFNCTKCGDPTDKGYSWVKTVWCPISLEILEREWDILCRPCYLAVAAVSKPYQEVPSQMTMTDYAAQALKGVKKVEKAEEKVMAAAAEIPED